MDGLLGNATSVMVTLASTAEFDGGGGGLLVTMPTVPGRITFPTPAATPVPTISDASRNCIITYCVLFLVGAIGNLSVFVSVGSELWRTCHRSRIKVLILHLSLADLFVILFVIPIEVFWRITVFWNGGDILCKICQFFRAFGLFLSSNIIICISLDRFYVILSPLKVIGGMRRVRNMLALAWLLAIGFAAPQCLIFSVHVHKDPVFHSVEQCDTLGFFKSIEDEIVYNMLSVSAMYFIPLVVILFTYVSVLIKVTRRSREHQNISEYHRRMLQTRLDSESPGPVTPDGLMVTSRILFRRSCARRNHPRRYATTTASRSAAAASNGTSTKPAPVTTILLRPSSTSTAGASGTSGAATASTNPGGTNATCWGGTSLVSSRRGSQFLRMSDTTNSIGRSRRKAFLLTMIIITAFVICWTPHVVVTCWYILDWKSAAFIQPIFKDAFFIMAVSNSCLNPLIYGNYMKRCYYGFCVKGKPQTVASEEGRSGGGTTQRPESTD